MHGIAIARQEVREPATVLPLIDAWEMFPALEGAIFEAKHDVLLAYWAFDQRLPLTSTSLGAGLKTWEDLLLAKARQGVAVRVLLTDFDPVMALPLHLDTVRSYRRLAALRAQLDEPAAQSFEAVLSLHDARVGRAAELLLQPIARRRLADHCRTANDLARREGEAALRRWLSCVPGLWRYVVLRDGRLHGRRSLIAIHPAVHHEKSCIVDGRIAFVGGLDIGPKQYDDRGHDTEIPWHDLACRLTGSPVERLGERLADRWSREQALFRDRCADLQAPPGVASLPVPGTASPPARTGEAPAPAVAEAADGEPAQPVILATRAASRTPALRMTPPPRDDGFRRALLDLIGSAERLLYIETQFLRASVIVDAILRQAARQPQLEVILLLPLVSDLMRNDSDPNAGSRHGQWLQHRAVRRLQRGLRHRFGVFTLVRNAPAPDDKSPQSRAYGSDMVYVHAKLAIADDCRLILGSANLNGRSLELDTEAGVAWADAGRIRSFRLRLWRHLLDGQSAGRSGDDRAIGDASQPHSPLTRWRRRAQHNAGLQPGERLGYVVPFPDAALGWRAERHWLLPDSCV